MAAVKDTPQEEPKPQETPKEEPKETPLAPTGKEESKETPQEEPAEPDVSSLDDMSAEDIQKAEAKPKKGKAKKEEPKEPPKETEPKKPEEKKPEETPKDERVPIGHDPEGNPVYYNDKGELVTGDRLKDTQAALTKTQEMLKQAQTELQQFRQKENTERFSDFVELDEKELKELEDEDPDDAKAYREELQEYQQYQTESQQRRATTQWFTILEAAQELTGTEVKWDDKTNMPVAFQQQPAELQKFLVEVIRKKIDPFVTENFRPNKDGIYTKDQILAAHKQLFFDDYVAKEKQGVREEVLNDIQKAAGGKGALDSIPKSPGGGGPKPLAEMTFEEISSLSPEEVEYYEQQAKR